MESGLEGRNNMITAKTMHHGRTLVSMESGLEGRNNGEVRTFGETARGGLNGVRPRRPEQSSRRNPAVDRSECLNGVRPRRPEQSGWLLVYMPGLGWSQWSPA